jgi:glycosyltransferase involved in cell wall biosynthesis
LIQHDYDFSAIFGQFQIGENRNKIIPYVVYSPHIHFVLNSEFSKNFIQQNFMHYGITLHESRTHVVPNYIFKDSFPKRTDIVKKRFQLVYASGWNKGIHSIIQIFDYILQKDKRFQLVLMSPGYEYKNYEQMRTFLKEKYKDNIIILGPLSKSIYSKTIQESGCVFAPPFPETFGCVFSESYYLETAVVADQRSGAVVEIIGQENITNYNDLEKTYKKVLECIEKPVQLNERFLFDVNMWKQVLQI